ncbi:hypothetical protein [Halodesulfovibrio spirochaetisodalis]|uniref:Uncharacterized protein n=1 Tax=Halodesulfovibrio spirochaetisodalis TaxID=1560234 RepID=A0A1B7XA02_9BACT|nr:hypothetical protein [Halodesulfovibrio spirochaetisodalis]OBQ46213.1 hypothetical protein SP90_13510 [Halodesulfovibrio spirochaetisodalis]
MRMFDNRLPQYGEYLGEAVTLPNSGTTALTGGPAKLSGSVGGTGVTVRCKTAVTIPSTKVLHLVVKDCDTADGTYKEMCRVTFQAGAYVAGKHLGEAVLPSQAKRFIKCDLVSDGACVGKVDVYPYATR